MGRRIIIFMLLIAFGHAVSIAETGGVADDDSDAASRANSVALAKAFSFANYSETDRVVVIPSGYSWSFYAVELEALHGIAWRVDGRALINSNISSWPERNNDGGNRGCFKFTRCNDMVIEGNGTIDGRGYVWWW